MQYSTLQINTEENLTPYYHIQYTIECTARSWASCFKCIPPHLELQSNTQSLNVSTTPITAMECPQCLPFNVVQLKAKHCRNPHYCYGVVDMFGLSYLLNWLDSTQRQLMTYCIKFTILYKDCLVMKKIGNYYPSQYQFF